MPERLITVGQFHWPQEAELVQGFLHSAGIESYLVDQETIHMDWFYSLALGGVKIRVEESHAAETIELLQTIKTAEPPLPEQTEVDGTFSQCPSCSSPDLKGENLTRKYYFASFLTLTGFYFILPFGNALALVVISLGNILPFAFFFLQRIRIQCLECNHSWIDK